MNKIVYYLLYFLIVFFFLGCTSDDNKNNELDYNLQNSSWTQDNQVTILDFNYNILETIEISTNCRSSYDFFNNGDGLESLATVIKNHPDTDCKIQISEISYFTKKKELVIRKGTEQIVYKIENLSDNTLELSRGYDVDKLIKYTFIKKTSK
ncbi:hypothetical protein [Myroides odoratus]|uniref:hypothetical protein n=1 Tax=Myroides odoratus TaxID=256 RepID=UPI000765969B|nr:hypothetical protein [Myroides odoratus]